MLKSKSKKSAKAETGGDPFSRLRANLDETPAKNRAKSPAVDEPDSYTAMILRKKEAEIGIQRPGQSSTGGKLVATFGK